MMSDPGWPLIGKLSLVAVAAERYSIAPMAGDEKHQNIDTTSSNQKRPPVPPLFVRGELRLHLVIRWLCMVIP